MKVENISSKENDNKVLFDDNGNALACRIELTLKEAEAILHSLGRTMCRGDQLNVSIELENRLVEALYRCR